MEEANRFVLFLLDERRYALRLEAVERVLPMVDITPLPKAPDIVLGVIVVRGRVIPAINLRRRFRLAEREPLLTDQLILAQAARRPVALAADAVTGVLERGGPDLVAADGILPGLEYLEGAVRLDDGLILIHDLGRLLSLEETAVLDRALGVG
jgi:purine-binding chemotaxis protein CheW